MRLLPLLTALGLAALYLVGAVVKVGELQGADVAVADALPLVPLSQILSTAIPVVVDSVVFIPVTVLLVHNSGRVVDWLGVRVHRFPTQAAALRARAEAIDAQLVDVERLTEEERRSLRREARECAAQIESLRQKPWVRGVAAVASIPRAWLRLLRYPLLALVALPLLALWLLTSPTLIAAGGAALSAAGALRHRPVVAGLAVYAVFLTAVLFEAFTAPDPLPVATVTTLDHRVQRGQLVAATDSQWHLAVGRHRLVSIPVDRIARSVLSSHPGGGGKPTWRILRDLLT